MDLEKTFDKAAAHLQTLVPGLSPEELLEFYGLYKQATVGPCNTRKPSWYQTQAKYKWEAWKKLGDMSRVEAMEDYIEKISSISPAWEDSSRSESQGWVGVSRLTNPEHEIDDADKTFLDWVKEGNAAKVEEMVRADPGLIELPDETGLLPLHWATDRGHVSIIRSLIRNGANVNSRDSDGQTALHYAASCGHVEAVSYLLSVGAELIEDNDGLNPKDIADEQVVSIF